MFNKDYKKNLVGFLSHLKRKLDSHDFLLLISY